MHRIPERKGTTAACHAFESPPAHTGTSPKRYQTARVTAWNPSPNQKEMDATKPSPNHFLCKGFQAGAILEQPDLFLVGTGVLG